MPGQRKRKSGQRAVGHTTPRTGRWEVLFETRDESEWNDHLRRLRAGPERIDWTSTRVDVLCGRLERATTYRLSRFVPDFAPDFAPGGGPGSAHGRSTEPEHG
ncbi:MULTISPECIES: hypothetical protein [unclassified Streptomyces]|uniref:hypothetical protein n=1 Tax=unclassified Streptomyces TaxID=2593676 RepID=UPI0037F3CA69